MRIFHITARAAWEHAVRAGSYRAESLAAEGFMHASTVEQILHVANSFYRAQAGLVLLEIDPAKLTSELKWEAAAGGPPSGVSAASQFPHVYGPLNIAAVVTAHDFRPLASGEFELPAAVRGAG